MVSNLSVSDRYQSCINAVTKRILPQTFGMTHPFSYYNKLTALKGSQFYFYFVITVNGLLTESPVRPSSQICTCFQSCVPFVSMKNMYSSEEEDYALLLLA